MEERRSVHYQENSGIWKQFPFQVANPESFERNLSWDKNAFESLNAFRRARVISELPWSARMNGIAIDRTLDQVNSGRFGADIDGVYISTSIIDFQEPTHIESTGIENHPKSVVLDAMSIVLKNAAKRRQELEVHFTKDVIPELSFTATDDIIGGTAVLVYHNAVIITVAVGARHRGLPD
ncbi:hypothetical protein FGB62_280g04 [Gracilaria domingensis]|nr:hypothetical protein FGB62_280g04 [Gracilaria domingensis]